MFQALHIRFETSYNDNMQTYIRREEISIKIGYCRVSSKSQNLDRQLVALQEQKVEKIFVEKISGKDKNRPKLQEMMKFIREGDTLIIESISRLARNTKDFLEIVNDLTERGVEVVSLKESIDTSTPQGKFICTIFGALYELERESIKQRQMEGISISKEKGTIFGRPPIQIDDNFMREYKRWKEGKQTAVDTYKKLDISRTSFYRKVKQIERSKLMNNRKLNIKEETTIS
jgi:DNA invertase Pin-like site-specific DNA recombinase